VICEQAGCGVAVGPVDVVAVAVAAVFEPVPDVVDVPDVLLHPASSSVARMRLPQAALMEERRTMIPLQE